MTEKTEKIESKIRRLGESALDCVCGESHGRLKDLGLAMIEPMMAQFGHPGCVVVEDENPVLLNFLCKEVVGHVAYNPWAARYVDLAGSAVWIEEEYS